MEKRRVTWGIVSAALALGVLVALVLAGCGGKRIYDGPPGAKVEAQPAQPPAPEAKAAETEPPAKAPEAAATAEQAPVPAAPGVRETQLVDEEIQNLRKEAQAGSTEVKAVPSATAAGPAHFVQVGAFGSLETAKGLLAKLIDAGYKESRIKTGSKGDRQLYRVQAGSFPDAGAARKALETLKADYPTAFVTN